MKHLLAVVIALASCSKGTANPPATEVNMRFDRASSFFDAPFPSDDLVRADGTIAMDAFPNPNAASLVAQAVALVARDARGFAQSGGAFFSLTGAIDPSRLPDLLASTQPDAKVFLVGVDATAPDFLRRTPVDVSFAVDGGPFGAPNLLSIVPLQGVPLRARETYAAVVLRALGDVGGAPLGVSHEMSELRAGTRPSGMGDAAFASYARALTALAGGGVAAADIAGLAVFTTDAPMERMALVRADALARPLPTLTTPLARTDVFPEYCVYASTLGMPVYQEGTPPYDKTGGDWAFDAAGKPVMQRTEMARIVVTVPRVPMPVSGFPAAVLVRTGAGGDRPLVDRGAELVHGGPPPTPGTGPALYFARAGFAGISVDGPHGGIRNVTNGDEQFLMFNIFNGAALRDNVRQSAVELVLLAHILEALTFDASDCAGMTGGPVKLDMAHAALMGHSMGSTIAPLVLAEEPLYGAAILSGAGGSWIENILFKAKPLAVRPAIELLLHYPQLGRSLVTGDPVLSLIQWAEEPADPQVYARNIVSEPAPGESSRHVLMEQGIVDHYIMPPIADALSLALGLDLAGDELDAKTPEVSTLSPLGPLLSFSGRSAIALPASGNYSPARGGRVTAVVVQHPEDGIEDGHEIVFQTDAPKHEYRCFLASYAAGAPSVPSAGTADAPCQ